MANAEDVVILQDALEETREGVFSISFFKLNGTFTEIKQATRGPLPKRWKTARKHFIGVFDRDMPDSHPIPVYLGGVQTINQKTVVL